MNSCPWFRPDEGRRRADAGQFFQHGHYVRGLAAPSDSDGQPETAVLIDHVQEFESAAVGRGIELESHGPHLVRLLSPVTSH